MSKYIISTVEGDTSTEVATRSEKAAAIAFADELHAENAGMVAVQVSTEAGTVVHELASIMEPDGDDEQVEVVEADGEAIAVVRTKPWTRLETAKFEAPEIDGATLAYSRTRIATGVYRKNDRSGWIVLDTRTGDRTEVENTVLAREVTNALSKADRTRRLELAAADKQAKAQAQADKKAKAAEDKKAKEAAKAEAKAAKEAAKAAEAEAPAEELADAVA